VLIFVQLLFIVAFYFIYSLEMPFFLSWWFLMCKVFGKCSAICNVLLKINKIKVLAFRFQLVLKSQMIIDFNVIKTENILIVLL
jgi:hypothetical protein